MLIRRKVTKFGLMAALSWVTLSYQACSPVALGSSDGSQRGSDTKIPGGGGLDGKPFYYANYSQCGGKVSLASTMSVASDGQSAYLLRENCQDLNPPQFFSDKDLRFAVNDSSVVVAKGRIFDHQLSPLLPEKQRVTVAMCDTDAAQVLIWSEADNSGQYFGRVVSAGRSSGVMDVGAPKAEAPSDFETVAGQTSSFKLSFSSITAGTLTYKLGSSAAVAAVINRCVTQPLPVNDGILRARAGVIPFPNLLTTYAVKPAWKVAGVDYAVGIPAGTILRNPASISMSGANIDAANRIVRVSGDNLTLDGYDFSLDGGWQIYVTGANLQIFNNKFVVGANNQVPIQAAYGGNLTVMYNEFDGGGPSGRTVNAMIETGTGATIEYNRFTNVPDDAIQIAADGVYLIQYNLFDSLNWNVNFASQPVQTFSSSIRSFTMQFNTMFQPPAGPAGFPGTMGSFVRIGDEGQGNTVYRPRVAYNTIVFQGLSGHAGEGGASANVFEISASTGQCIEPSVHDNFVDASGVLYAVHAPDQQELTDPMAFDNLSLLDGKPLLSGPYNSQVAGVPANPPSPPVIGSAVVNGSRQALIDGSAPPGLRVQVFSQSGLLGSVTAAANGKWTLTSATLAVGPYAFSARATDAYANTSKLSNSVSALVP